MRNAHPVDRKHFLYTSISTFSIFWIDFQKPATCIVDKNHITDTLKKLLISREGINLFSFGDIADEGDKTFLALVVHDRACHFRVNNGTVLFLKSALVNVN